RSVGATRAAAARPPGVARRRDRLFYPNLSAHRGGLFPFFPPQNSRRGSEFPPPRFLGVRPRRAAIFRHAANVGQDFPSALETLYEHVERIVSKWHHVGGEPGFGIPLIEPRFELGTDIAVCIPAALEQFRPLAR